MTVMDPVIEWLQRTRKKKVTLSEIVKEVERPRRPVLRVMDKFAKEGYLKEIDDGKDVLKYGEVGPMRRNPTWRILSKPLPERKPARRKKRNIRDRIWKAMRDKRRFTRKEIRRLTGVSEASVEKFGRILEDNGYVKQISKDGRERIYVLFKDPGPARPRIKEKKNG